MSESDWLVERVLCPDGPPLLQWVGARGGALQARFVTDWPPTEEDVDYMHERVKRDPVLLDDRQVAERLAEEGFPDAEVRPLTAAEADHLATWRPFAIADRLLERSTRVTIHGARCDAVLPIAALAALERVGAATPRLVTIDAPAPLQMLIVLRRDDARWRLDAGHWPRQGQSLQTWLAGQHVRLTLARETPNATDITLSGIRQQADAEHLIIALQALEATCSIHPNSDQPARFNASLDCSRVGSLSLRVLPEAAAHSRTHFRHCFA